MTDRWHSPKDQKTADASDRLQGVNEEVDRLHSLLSGRTAEQKDDLLYAALSALLKGERVEEKEEINPQVRDDAAIEAAIEWLWEKWNKAHCPYCGEGPWEVEGPFSIRLDGEATLSPFFTVMCTNCGQTAFVSAAQAGIADESHTTGGDG